MILIDVAEEIGYITFNRPRQLNALNQQLAAEIETILKLWARDPKIKVVILTGGKRCFSAGADLTEVLKQKTASPEAWPEPFISFLTKVRQSFNTLERFPKPVIAAISGIAYGGGMEISLISDIRIASETASFSLPEVKIGILPAGGGTQRLARLLGAGGAKEMLLTGEPINASQAKELGLVSQVVSEVELLDAAKNKAEALKKCAPLSLSAIKECVQVSLSADLETGLDFELAQARALSYSRDLEEGLLAFSEKRSPVYHGR